MPNTSARPSPPSASSTQRPTWTLSGPALWVVERGAVDVFLVTRNGPAAGRRRHLLRATPGDPVGGLGDALRGSEAALVAVGTASAVLGDAPSAVASSLRADWTHRLAQAIDADGVDARPTASPDDPASDVDPADDLRAVQTRVAHQLVRFLHANRTAETDRLTHRDRHHRSALDGALKGLAAVVHALDGSTAEADANDTLLTACRHVARAQHIELVSPSAPDADSTRPSAYLDAIARASGVRTRRVALRDRWWTQDNGPLLARIDPLPATGGESVSSDTGDSSSHEESVRPVALLPERPGHYVCVDPTTGTRRPVDDDLASTLHPFAYSFYRPFPDGPLSWMDVLRFGLASCRHDLLLVLLVSAAAALLSTATPIVTGLLIDDVIPSADRGRLIEWIAMLLVVVAVSACFQVTRSFALLRLQGRVEADVQAAMWDRLLSLPLSFFRRFTAGDVAQRAMSVSRIQRLLAGPALTSLLGGLFSVFHFGLLFVYNPFLAVWAVGLSGLAFGVILGGSLLQLRLQRRITDLGHRLSGLVLQLLTGIAKLRVAGAETTAFTRWADVFGRKRRLQMQQRRIGVGMHAVVRVAPLLVTLAVFALLAPSLRAGAAPQTGDLLAFLAALTTGLQALLSTRTAVAQIAQVIPLYETARPLLRTEPESDTGRSAPGRLSGRIDLSHVSFRYSPTGPRVINDVTLRIDPGSFIALVGPSGSGKSTLLRLLLGFETPDAGTISYDDRDLAGLDVRAVRRQIGVVLQDGALMPGDVLTNIIGSTRATTDDAWEAARKAGLADDIQAMPMGLHTVVGAGASTLSGGQVQRLLIARAIVHRPRLLFFDEATSALDNRTQAQVSRSLDGLDATRVVVAHRLSTVRHADRIIVLDAGRVVESGTYDELLAAKGLFADLAARQST